MKICEEFVKIFQNHHGMAVCEIECSFEGNISEPTFLDPVSPQGVGMDMVRSETRSKTMQ